jgi:hypothetical protein
MTALARRTEVALLAPLLLVTVGLVALPSLPIVGYALLRWTFMAPGEALTLANDQALLGSPVTWAVAGNTLAIALPVTALSVVAGYGLAYAIVFGQGPGRQLLFLLVVTALMASYLVRIYSWRLLLLAPPARLARRAERRADLVRPRRRAAALHPVPADLGRHRHAELHDPARGADLRCRPQRRAAGPDRGGARSGRRGLPQLPPGDAAAHRPGAVVGDGARLLRDLVGLSDAGLCRRPGLGDGRPAAGLCGAYRAVAGGVLVLGGPIRGARRREGCSASGGSGRGWRL